MKQENYFEQELLFIRDESQKTLSRGLNDPAAINEIPFDSTEILGVKIQLGNQPLVYDFKELLKKAGKDSTLLADGKDHYLIVHSISALRTKGKAKIDELQYFASSIAPLELQTVDLIPKTRFNEIVKADLAVMCALNLNGEVALNVPPILTNNLLSDIINIGADIKLELSTTAGFIGKFTYSIQLPVVQSAGIGSNTCSWILNPDENKTPLLGDQLLIQIIAVAPGTKTLTYKISGHVKADRGIFWKQKELSTQEYTLSVKLNQDKN